MKYLDSSFACLLNNHNAVYILVVESKLQRRYRQCCTLGTHMWATNLLACARPSDAFFHPDDEITVDVIPPGDQVAILIHPLAGRPPWITTTDSTVPESDQASSVDESITLDRQPRRICKMSLTMSLPFVLPNKPLITQSQPSSLPGPPSRPRAYPPW
jgi:hypothetical protein